MGSLKFQDCLFYLYSAKLDCLEQMLGSLSTGLEPAPEQDSGVLDSARNVHFDQFTTYANGVNAPDKGVFDDN